MMPTILQNSNQKCKSRKAGYSRSCQQQQTCQHMHQQITQGFPVREACSQNYDFLRISEGGKGVISIVIKFQLPQKAPSKFGNGITSIFQLCIDHVIVFWGPGKFDVCDNIKFIWLHSICCETILKLLKTHKQAFAFNLLCYSNNMRFEKFESPQSKDHLKNYFQKKGVLEAS